MDMNEVEKAVHHTLANKNLDVSIVGPNGKMIIPKEWFVVSLEDLQKVINEIVIRVNL